MFHLHILMNVYLFCTHCELYMLVQTVVSFCIKTNTAHKTFYWNYEGFYCIVAMLYWVTFNKKTLNIPPLYWYLKNMHLCLTLFLNRWLFMKQYIKVFLAHINIYETSVHLTNITLFTYFVIRVCKQRKSISTGSKESLTSHLRFHILVGPHMLRAWVNLTLWNLLCSKVVHYFQIYNKITKFLFILISICITFCKSFLLLRYLCPDAPTL